MFQAYDNDTDCTDREMRQNNRNPETWSIYNKQLRKSFDKIYTNPHKDEEKLFIKGILSFSQDIKTFEDFRALITYSIHALIYRKKSKKTIHYFVWNLLRHAKNYGMLSPENERMIIWWNLDFKKLIEHWHILKVMGIMYYLYDNYMLNHSDIRTEFHLNPRPFVKLDTEKEYPSLADIFKM